MKRILSAILLVGMALMAHAQPSAPTTNVQLNLTTSGWQTSSGINLGTFYNVRVFGAKGDGVTDDSAAIQSASNACAAGTVYFPPGNYLISSAVGINCGSNQIWTGTGATLTMNFSTSYGILRFLSQSNSAIRNLIFDAKSGLGPLVYLVSDTNIEVSGCSFLNESPSGSGISGTGLLNFKFLNNYFSCNHVGSNAGFTNSAILLFNSIGNNIAGLIEWNFGTNSGFTLQCANTEVSHNIFNGWQYGAAISIGDLTNDEINNIVSYNIGYNSFGLDTNSFQMTGIEALSPYSVYSHNVMHNCSGAGILEQAHDSVVSDNILYDNGTGPQPDFGIQMLSGSDRSAISGNRCFNTVQSAKTVTISVASPAVVTLAAHGLQAGIPIVFATTGALPTGITAGTTYWIIGANLTTNTFEFSTSYGGVAVNTTGTQSGTQTITGPQQYGYSDGNSSSGYPAGVAIDASNQFDGNKTGNYSISGGFYADPVPVPLFASPLNIATQTPASSSAVGAAGTITWDSGFIYVCIATNTWKRVAISTW